MALAVTYLISSCFVVQRAIIYRKMDFKRLAVVENLSTLTGGTSAICLAVYGLGVWSLVWQALISTLVGAVLFWINSNWHPRLRFNLKAVSELMGFSSSVLGINVVNYWIRCADNLLVGKFFGSVELGIYARAHGLMFLPIKEISYSISRVMFPALSNIQDDRIRSKRMYLRAISVISVFTFPVMMGMIVTADHLIITVFGLKWAGAIPIVRILCFAGMVRSITSTLSWIFQSQGKAYLMFKWNIISGTILILSMVIGVWTENLRDFALCFVFVNVFIVAYPEIIIAGRLIQLSFKEVFYKVSDAFLSALLMSAVLMALNIVMPATWDHWLHLAIQVPVGGGLYFLLIHLFRLDGYIEVKKLVRKHIARS